MVQIYQRGKFKIYAADSWNGSCYILHNSAIKGFSHTHLKTYKTCLYLIELSLQQKLPYDLPKYLVQSLYRVNEGEYQRKVGELLDNKDWSKKYINVNKGVKKHGKSKN